MLKKIILVVISLVAAGALGYYLANLVRDRATSPEALPEKVLTFITEHFQDEKIAFAKEDRDLFKLTYEIVLTDGTKLEFRRNGDWKEIKRHRISIPEGIVPQDSVITKAEYDDNDLELELDNGLELKFGKEYELIGLEH